MKVFVAGATGDLGRRVVPLLGAAGHDVTGVARSPEKADLLRRAGATPVEVDIFDRSALESVVAGHDVVVNIATHVPSTARSLLPRATREHERIRTEGARALAAAALASGAQRYVQESLTFPYADGGDRWLDESAEWVVPETFTAVTAAESAAAGVTESGATGVVLRFALLHSPDGHVTRDSLRFARSGLALVPGDPSAYLAAVHVDDAASAVVAALDVPSGVYNVTDDDPLTRSEYVEALARAVGRRRVTAPQRLLRIAGGSRVEVLGRSQRVSNRTLKTLTGWAPTYPSMREALPAVAGARR